MNDIECPQTLKPNYKGTSETSKTTCDYFNIDDILTNYNHLKNYNSCTTQ